MRGALTFHEVTGNPHDLARPSYGGVSDSNHPDRKGVLLADTRRTSTPTRGLYPASNPCPHKCGLGTIHHKWGNLMPMTRSPLRDLSARRVQEEMQRQSMNATELTEITGIPLSVLNARLTGAEPFDVDELNAIARALTVPVVSLLTPLGA